MENVYLEAIALLKENQPFVMATIVDGVGSTPRGTASKMIVRQDGSIFATIGGGQMRCV